MYCTVYVVLFIIIILVVAHARDRLRTTTTRARHRERAVCVSRALPVHPFVPAPAPPLEFAVSVQRCSLAVSRALARLATPSLLLHRILERKQCLYRFAEIILFR